MELQAFKVWCKDNVYSLLIIISAILGLICGFIMKSIFTISPLVLTYIGLPGKLVIRAFMMIIVPLIVSSLATIDNSGDPGVDIKQMIASQDESIYDVFMNLIPDNIIAATFSTHYTALVPIDSHNLTLGYKKLAERAFKPNMLGLCVFSLILGFAVKQLDSKADTIRRILVETNDISNADRNVLLDYILLDNVDGLSGCTIWWFIYIIGIDNPLDILAYTMTMDWLMERVRTMGNV
ncbi:unnamed protein product [Oppiella nova]|uniref:Amino acid transporter n=1 Tax=Oppiella nova TaxID=334625 RepID=A0A7R9LXD1_9ACAR|nr:unnamed protein product [Oppiella nova]CAG2167810.1 unnamed protein product [Oppiella nova]